MSKKVFITSSGQVSSLGFTLNEMQKHFIKKKTGLKRISSFDTARLRTNTAGEVNFKKLLQLIGFEKIVFPFFKKPLFLRDNPKLAFALWACGQALDYNFTTQINKINKTGLIRAIYSTAGLEKIDISALSQALINKSDIIKIRPLCKEVPPSFIGEILAWYFGFDSVPPVTTSSACAASTQAIGQAFRDIKTGKVDQALAGGTDSMIFEFGINAFNSIGALAEKTSEKSISKVRAFDSKRSGTLLGEGAAFFLLESEKSIAISHNIPMAEITGYASSLDAWHPVKPHPKGLGAKRAIKNALHGQNVDYINAHGSGTFHNDIAESNAMKSALNKPLQPIISSTKPFHGHLLTAGGALETAAILCALKKGLAPINLNLEQPDPGCDLQYPSETDSSPKFNKKIKRAMNNSFGLNGQNGVLILKAV